VSIVFEVVMAKRCEICGKGPVAGSNVSHSKVHTRRRFMPNLVTAHVVPRGGGLPQKVRVCTRCLRTSAKTA
jgi:large subunit ribosomal protein L28